MNGAAARRYSLITNLQVGKAKKPLIHTIGVEGKFANNANRRYDQSI